MDESSEGTISETADCCCKPAEVSFTEIPEFLVLHRHYTTCDLRNWHGAPRRLVARRDFVEPGHFADYVNAMKGPTYFCGYTSDPPRFVAVLDYHQPPDRSQAAAGEPADEPQASSEASPRWCSHVAALTPRFSRAFRTWTGRDYASPNKVFSPAEFGEFIEENAPDIIEPPAARMMDIAHNLTVAKAVEARTHERLEDGSVIYHFAETVTGNVKLSAGPIDIPREFKLMLPIFEGTQAVEFRALFRYRATPDRGVAMFYKLQRLDASVEAAVEGIVERLDGLLDTDGRLGLLRMTPEDLNGLIGR